MLFCVKIFRHHFFHSYFHCFLDRGCLECCALSLFAVQIAKGSSFYLPDLFSLAAVCLLTQLCVCGGGGGGGGVCGVCMFVHPFACVCGMCARARARACVCVCTRMCRSVDECIQKHMIVLPLMLSGRPATTMKKCEYPIHWPGYRTVCYC